METEFSWKLIDGVPTYIIHRGEICNKKPLILIIPGNPGVADFYQEFIEYLDKECNNLLPIFCISHAGHVTLPKHLHSCDGYGKKWLTVNDQIRHKLTFLQNHVPPGTPLILIGHSIGCYMILEMLKCLESDRVLKCFLLFPTIERMSQSVNGRIFTPIAQYLRWFLPVITYPLYYLVPEFVKSFLIERHFPTQCAINGVMKLTSPLALGSSFHLAHDEMHVVQQANYGLISSNIDRLVFYYGTRDRWCPLEYCKQMKERFPEADIHVCQHGFEHAFVLKSSSEMASLLSGWILKAICHLQL